MADRAPVMIDSSCLVAIALGEPEAARMRTSIDRAPARYAATLVEAELMAALVRERLPADTAPIGGIGWISPPRRLTRELTRVMSSGQLRGADAWHLACALYLDPSAGELAFVTLDRRQRDVAKALGFQVL